MASKKSRGSAYGLGLFALLAAVSSAGCGSGPPAADFGQSCSATTPCAGGLMCFAAIPPNGYCTSDCSAAPCAAGGVCDDALGGRFCLRACASASDCRGELQCFGGVCRPPCTSDAGCGSGTCGADGRCTGPECATSADCSPGLTCTGGRCTTPIETDANVDFDAGTELRGDGVFCSDSAQCVSGLCLPPDRGGVCTNACADEDTCFAASFSSSCGPATIGGTVGTYCIPYREGARGPAAPCTSDTDCSSSTCAEGQCARVCNGMEDCVLGQTCTTVSWNGSGFTGCGYAPAGGLEVRTIDLGDYAIRAGTGTPDITFATPPSAVSVMLRARLTGGDPLTLSFYEVEDGLGAQIFSIADISDYVDTTIRWFPSSDSPIAMLIPNTTTDRYAFVHGRMRVSTLAYARMAGDTGIANVHVDALVTLAPGGVASGSLNVRVHLVGVGVSAASAPTNSRVQAFVTRFSEIIGQTNIAIGSVSYVDIAAPALAIIDSEDGADSELSQLFRMSAPTEENVLNLFLVQEVRAGGDGFNTLGIAGGIPGPARLGGTSHSGVVIAFDASVVGGGTGGGRLAGHVAAHEVSHFLGLYHVTERARPCGPGEVPSASVMCSPFGGGDVLADTTRGDTGNLMNWSIVGSGSNDAMSPGQAFVELRNPLAH